MKKFIIGLVLVFATLFVTAQNTVTIKHKQYETSFDTVLKYPTVVKWLITKQSLSCTTKYPRPNKFTPDPNLYKATNIDVYYVGSGYDRGHNYPAADGACDSTAMRESFYFSNMTAQDPSVNRGDWKDLEEFVRSVALQNDSVKIWCGSWGSLKKIGRVTVPTDCWKVVYIVKTKQWIAYQFPNVKTTRLGIKAREVPLSVITSKTNIKFE